MAVRPIDANALIQGLKNNRLHILLENENDGAAVFDDIVNFIDYAPTLNPPNEPLTLEQLRKMDGEPVWVRCLKPNKYVNPPIRWRILEKSIMGTFGVWDGEDGLVERSYGTDWLAYRRPPEGEKNT